MKKHKVLFDIMTGPERRLTTPSEPHHTLRRYLTPFYGFTLGLALLLAIFAGVWHVNPVMSIATSTQEAFARTTTPTNGSTPVPVTDTPTSLPAIPPTPYEATPSPLGVSAAELRGTTLTLWHPWIGSMGAVLQHILDEFNNTNRWGITVQAIGYEGFGRLDEAMEASLTSAASPDEPGSLPDVIVDYGYQARLWDKADIFANLTPYVNDPVWGYASEEQADFYPAFWAEDNVFDQAGDTVKRLGIPFYRSAYVLFYNQSWGRELGYLKPPSTPRDFRGQACSAANAYANQGEKSTPGKGGWLVTPQPGALVGWIYAFGGSITDSSAREYVLNNSQTRQAIEYLKGLQISGCAWYTTEINFQAEFAARRALFIAGSLFDIAAQQQAMAQAGNADEWVIIPFPSDRKVVVSTYGPSLFLRQSTPAKQLAAWLVIEWLVYPPNQAAWVSELKAYPTRSSTLNYLSEAAATNSQWAEALELLPDAHSEPGLTSWKLMRWSLSDALAQLFDPQFTIDQVPALMENLNNVAAEILAQVP
jgi:multiple sugar transport system substrate-binding protein